MQGTVLTQYTNDVWAVHQSEHWPSDSNRPDESELPRWHGVAGAIPLDVVSFFFTSTCGVRLRGARRSEDVHDP